MPLRFLLTILTAAAGLHVEAAVDVTVAPPVRSDEPQGKRTIRKVTLANELAHYTLTYDIIRPPDSKGEVISHWWIWTTDYVSLGMSEPTLANWYWQGFFNWHFDDKSLYNWPATFRVIRNGGKDGLVEFAWDTPEAKATVRFAMTTGCDKLLMFGNCEPKAEFKENYLQLICYPATFKKPHHRAVTTAARTVRPGGNVELDFKKERWALYEDTAPDRPAGGSAGLIVGTPESFQAVTIPVGGYGITTRLAMKPDKRSFALALYSFPTLPDYEETRTFFRASADTEAAWLEEVAETHLKGPLPPLPIPRERIDLLRQLRAKLFDRPAERWNPIPKPLPFPWAKKHVAGPINTVIFSPRWCAFETMELARRLAMNVRHLHFDMRSTIASVKMWPYAGTTGIGTLGNGVTGTRAAELCTDPKTELYLLAGIAGSAVPGVARTALLQQVDEGKSLLLVGDPGMLSGWPKELFASPVPEVAESVLSAFDWEQIPGYRKGERGRIGTGPPLQSYSYGKGTVLVLKVRLGVYSSLVPGNSADEGLAGATDRCLALAARAALAAAGKLRSNALLMGTARPDEPPQIPLTIAPEFVKKGSLLVRVQDDLDRVIDLRTVPLPLKDGRLELPPLPTGRETYLDVILNDELGRCIDFATRVLPAAVGPALDGLTIKPAFRIHEAAPPRIDMPEGGKLECSVQVTSKTPLANATLEWEIRDAFERVMGRASTDVPAKGGSVAASLRINRPVTVAHVLDVSLRMNGTEIGMERLHFTAKLPYSYDDFTVLMWSYAGGEPVLQRTNRLCYEWGADVMDLCHMGRYSDTGAAREYRISARSGLRLLPYVTWMGAKTTPDYFRVPCLHSPNYLEKVRNSLTVTCRQAAPYSPVAFTLGDENYLFTGTGEVCHRPESINAFRGWLRKKYENIQSLNAIWASEYDSFDAIRKPMLRDETAAQTKSFAAWMDHKRFMDTSFAGAHEDFADVVRKQVPGAKVGWDGFLGYGWQAGYDFTKMTENLELNQVYTVRWLQGELVRSFKRPDALTGKWGNSIADTEAGFSAWPWDCLLAGDNSVWWWTSWGCDYIPFNPDLSQSNFGKWFFQSAGEITAGPGRLLLHAEREHSGIGVLYSQPDLFVSAIMKKLAPDAEFSANGNYWKEHKALLKALKDLGYQYRHVSYRDLEGGKLSNDEYRILFLTLPGALSDRQVATLRRFVEKGGTLAVDGRAGLLTGDGLIRTKRPMDDLLGIQSQAGLNALKQRPAKITTTVEGNLTGTSQTMPLRVEEIPLVVLEPDIKVTTGHALAMANQSPVLVVNAVGKGRAVTLNFLVQELFPLRAGEGPKPYHEILSSILRSAGLSPFCELNRPKGGRPLCIEQVLFKDGGLQYLALQQDLSIRSLPEQKVRVEIPRPAVIYNLRAGARVGKGKMRSWDATLSRGRPQVFSLLPYEVTAVSIEADTSARPGDTLPVNVNIGTEPGKAEFHVVRLNVFAPGSDRAHRQYSVNIPCPAGKGAAKVPFALNDPQGRWRFEARDVASGRQAELVVMLERE